MHEALRDDFADVFGLRQLLRARGENVIERREMPREGFGHARADVQNAEAEQQPPQVALFAGGDAVEKILRGFLAHAFEADGFEFQANKGPPRRARGRS